MRRERGFTLIEMLVALAIAGLLLVSALTIHWQEHATARRLVAHRNALLALEAAHETLREHPEASFPGVPLLLPITFATTPDPPPEVHVGDVRNVEGMANLLEVDLVVTYRAIGRGYRRALTTRLWVRPEP